MKKIVLTGAAGRLGSYLREPMTKMADELVSTDIVDDIGTLYPGESYQRGDLASMDDMLRVLEGAEMVVHMGLMLMKRLLSNCLGRTLSVPTTFGKQPFDKA